MKYQLWLSNIKGISSAKIMCMLQEASGAQEIYGLRESALCKIKGITLEDVGNIIQSKQSWNLEEEVLRLNMRGVSFVSWEQKDYPEKLRHINHPPYGLYYIGHLPDSSKRSVAIVGARGCSAYGGQFAEKLAYALAKQDVNIISGLARGIDAEAHKGCMRGDGNTYAVLGCGINLCYPRQNQYIYDEILKKGGILSEYPIDTQPHPGYFPSRNRIIAGLCDTVVVAEAKIRSGSLITADFAMEQGKDVYALPGRVTDSLSGGCNRLIEQGAGIVLGVEEFVKDYLSLQECNAVQMDFAKNLLEKEELMVYSLLDFCPISLGSLMEMTRLPIGRLNEILFSLGQKQFIKEEIPNYYVRVI